MLARSVVAKWSAATAYNRGQVLYRIAEVMEGRREQFISEVSDSDGVRRERRAPMLTRDRPVGLVRGLGDKYAWRSATNPADLFNFSVPAHGSRGGGTAGRRVLGLVSVVAPSSSPATPIVVPSCPDQSGHHLAECLAIRRSRRCR